MNSTIDAMQRHDRTRRMMTPEEFAALRRARVCVVGLGGVGGGAVEALVRAGVGCLRLVDFDIAQAGNLNRQLMVTDADVGLPKTECARRRVEAIAPDAVVELRPVRLSADNVGELIAGCDVVLDCIDDVAGKIALAQAVNGVLPLIAAMGTGNKWHPERLAVTDLAKTTHCPLAKKMRVELGKLGIRHLPVVASDEQPVAATAGAIGSLAFVPPVAGMLMAGWAVRVVIGRQS